MMDSGNANRVNFATNPPLSGNWRNGDIIFNSNASPGGFIGWVFTSNQWKGFGLIES